MVELARRAEALGFGHVWIGDSHLIWREAYVTLTAAALATTRVVLGTGVTNLVTRDPAVVASAFATLHEAMPGRFVLGAGLGDSAVETMGKRPSRLATFEQAVARMRGLLAGAEVATESGALRLKHAAGGGLPIYVAASGPRMLELAGRIADGVIALVGVEPERVRRAFDAVRAGACAAGRAAEAVDLVLWVPCAVAADGGAARAAVKAHVARAVNRPLPFPLDDAERQVVEAVRRCYDYSAHMERAARQAAVVPDWLVDRFAVAGTPAECRAAVERLRATGVRQLAVIPYGAGGADRAATLRAVAETVAS
jgi:5,10-methylenetetrahydromethanopterin reductase